MDRDDGGRRPALSGPPATPRADPASVPHTRRILGRFFSPSRLPAWLEQLPSEVAKDAGELLQRSSQSVQRDDGPSDTAITRAVDAERARWRVYVDGLRAFQEGLSGYGIGRHAALDAAAGTSRAGDIATDTPPADWILEYIAVLELRFWRRYLRSRFGCDIALWCPEGVHPERGGRQHALRVRKRPRSVAELAALTTAHEQWHLWNVAREAVVRTFVMTPRREERGAKAVAAGLRVLDQGPALFAADGMADHSQPALREAAMFSLAGRIRTMINLGLAKRLDVALEGLGPEELGPPERTLPRVRRHDETLQSLIPKVLPDVWDTCVRDDRWAVELQRGGGLRALVNRVTNGIIRLSSPRKKRQSDDGAASTARRELPLEPHAHGELMAAGVQELDPLEAFATREEAARIERLVASLPERQKQVLRLHRFEGRSHREIAALLGITEGGSKSNLSKARKSLKRMLA